MDALHEALVQVNVSLPVPIDRESLLKAIHASDAAQGLAPALRVLVEEVPAETLHLLVLAGVITFNDIKRVKDAIHSDGGANGYWIDEMARLELARDAERSAAGA